VQVVYRNITFSIWRPQSIRQILRTNVGDSADPAPASGPWCANAAGNGGTTGAMQCVNYGVDRPDAFVAIKRIRYTPLNSSPWAPGGAIADAFRCSGMAYCTNPTRRNLTVVPVLSSSVITSSAIVSGGPGGVAGRRLLQNTPTDNEIAQTISSSVPGLSALSVNVSVSSFGIGGYIAIVDPSGFITASKAHS
jgi:hypothetical protein